MTGSSKDKFFEGRYSFRFSEEIMKDVNFLLRVCLDEDNEPRFENISHFVRVALIRFIKEEKQKIVEQDLKRLKEMRKNGRHNSRL